MTKYCVQISRYITPYSNIHNPDFWKLKGHVGPVTGGAAVVLAQRGGRGSVHPAGQHPSAASSVAASVLRGSIRQGSIRTHITSCDYVCTM